MKHRLASKIREEQQNRTSKKKETLSPFDIKKILGSNICLM